MLNDAERAIVLAEEEINEVNAMIMLAEHNRESGVQLRKELTRVEGRLRELRQDAEDERGFNDQETDALISSLQHDIIAITAILISEESWIKATFTGASIRSCTISINGLPQSSESNMSDGRKAVARIVCNMVLRLVTCENQWQFSHTGLLAFRCRDA